ncbi:MAG: hypothetical protein E7316_05755 [Clostridiales bacterium]|nr:hypothetical protein [Clostridiales bacterium]
MPNLHRARVVAIGTEADMIRLNRTLLRNMDCLEEPEDGPALTLEELYRQVRHNAQYEGAQDSSFLYDMIALSPFGDAEDESCRYVLRQESCGLYTACFAYEGETSFQPEDWLSLHMQCGRIPMLALRASWDFALDKGMVIISGGRIHDNWDRMAESWLWLLHQYEFGYPPEEAVARLAKLEVTLEREDFDMSIAELLESCVENLEYLGDTSDITQESLVAARDEKDFALLFEMIARIGETALWETEHNARWLACLEAVQQAWQEREEA